MTQVIDGKVNFLLEQRTTVESISCERTECADLLGITFASGIMYSAVVNTKETVKVCGRRREACPSVWSAYFQPGCASASSRSKIADLGDQANLLPFLPEQKVVPCCQTQTGMVSSWRALHCYTCLRRYRLSTEAC